MKVEYRLDDKYTTGVYYDQMNGDFAKIQRGVNDEGERIVELVNPENNDVYYDMPVQKWVQSEKQDFRPVSEQAVNDPTKVVNRALCMMSRHDVNELAGYPEKEAIDLRYARQQIEIVGASMTSDIDESDVEAAFDNINAKRESRDYESIDPEKYTK